MTNLRLVLIAAFLASPAAANSVDSAFKLCMLFDRTGLASAPCDVSGWDSSVNVKIDMTAAEARRLCPQIAEMARSEGWSFDDGWMLNIYSPYSGENSIAYCGL